MNDCCRYNDAVGGGTSDDPDHSDSYMSNSTLDEHGSVTTTTSNLKAWVMGNDGTWVQSSQTFGYSGSGGKGSTYTFNDDDQTHDVETQVFPDSSVLVNKDNNDVSNSHDTTVTESYSYNNGITIDGTGPTTWGGGTATRTTTSQDGRVQSGNWEVDTPHSATIAGTSSSNSSTNSTKKYTEAWGPGGVSTRLELDSTTNTHSEATATVDGVPMTGSPSVTDTPSSDHETITGSSGLDFLYSGTPNAATFVGKAIGGAWTRATVTVNADQTETWTPADAATPADSGGGGGSGSGGSGTTTGGGATTQPTYGLPISTDFAIYSRPIKADTIWETIGGWLGTHAFISNTPQANWKLGDVVGRGVTDTKAKKGDKVTTKEIYAPDQAYVMKQELYRAKAKLQYGFGAGKSGLEATDAEIWDSIIHTPMAYDYRTGFYDCRGWPETAAKASGLSPVPPFPFGGGPKFLGD